MYIAILLACNHEGRSRSLGKSVLTPFTKSAIPAEVIARRTNNSMGAGFSNLEALLYEVTKEGLLVGPGTVFNIESVTKFITNPERIPGTINGEKLQHGIKPPVIRKGGGYTIVYGQDAADIVSISGNGVFLEPLGKVTYPNIFVDIMKRTNVDNDEDMILRPGHNLSDGPPTKILPFTDPESGTQACRTVEVAVAFDNTYCQKFSNSTTNAIASVQATINYANSIYERDLCITIALVHVEAHCNDLLDPYQPLTQSTSGTKMVEGFKSIWELSRNHISRDLAYFFSGFEDGTSTIGTAYVGAACSQFAYGWVEHGSGPTFVHELGHSLGALHSDSGIMQAALVYGESVFFSSVSVSEIANYLLDTSSFFAPFCIEDTAPVCDQSCPGQCIGGHCVSLYDESVREEFIPCVLIQNSFLCVNRFYFYDYEISHGVNCQSGFDFKAPTYEEEMAGSNLFCCLRPTEMRDTDIYPVEYGTGTLTLIYPDRNDTIQNYIPGTKTQFITEATLLNTELVPDCGKQVSSPTSFPSSSPSSLVTPTGFASPSPSSVPSQTPFSKSPNVSPMPSTAPSLSPSPIASSTMSISPTPSSSLSPSASAPPPNEPSVRPSLVPLPSSSPARNISCSSTLSSSKTFSCSLSKGRISVRGGIGTVRVKMRQKSGQFQAKVYTKRILNMTDITAGISMNPGLRYEDLGGTRKLYGSEQKSHLIAADAFEMAAAPSVNRCCGEPVYLYLSVRVCRKAICRRSRLVRFSSLIQCEDPCRSMGTGTAIPFSSVQRCPSCV